MSDRFDRQVRFAPLGEAGQARLAEARVLLVGCGALGGVLFQELARAGVGTLVVVDRDIVELSNLPRQVLFEERHAAEGTPKVEAAAEALERIGGPTRLEAHAAHLDAANIDELAKGCDLLLDGTDNMPTRYLLNDYCIEEGVPWVYGGVVGSHGLVLPVLPGSGACLRCLFPDPPPAGSLDTCDTAGVIVPAVAAIASIQAGLALRLLVEGRETDLEPALLQLDVWTGEVVRIAAPQRAGCPACGDRLFPFRHDPDPAQPIAICGRNSVQVPAGGSAPDLSGAAARLEGLGQNVVQKGGMLRFEVDELRLTVFPDGRTLVEGTKDKDRARSVVDRYLGG